MLPSDSDPIVEILRLAYRRGLAIRRELTKKMQDAATEEQKELDPDTTPSSGFDQVSEKLDGE
jgi:hypothetical protein